jgi:hypothetical protein
LGAHCEPETPDQDLHAVRLVDEVGCASFESQGLVVGQGIAGQEYNRQVHAVAAQLWEEVDAQDIRKAPIWLRASATATR